MTAKTLDGECCGGATNGINGTNGTNGTNGINGLDATMSIGTVTTGAPGSSVIITNTGTSTNAIWNYTIPRGDVGATGAAGAAGANGSSPISKTFWQDESIPTVGSAFSVSTVTGVPYDWRVYQASAAQNDSWYQTFTLAATTYTLAAVGQQDSNKGIQTWYIDGVSQGTMDWYRASTLNLIQTLAVTVVGTGTHTITSTILSKNGASSGYQLFITKFSLT